MPPIPKPEPHDKVKRRENRRVAKHVKTTRDKVFDRDEVCRLCGCNGSSMHEMRFASLVGDREQATTLENSIRACGSGTTGCHGLLQRNIVIPLTWDARKPIRFMLKRGYESYADVQALVARYRSGRRDELTYEEAAHT